MGKLLSASDDEEKIPKYDGNIWYGNIVWEIIFFSRESVWDFKSGRRASIWIFLLTSQLILFTLTELMICCNFLKNGSSNFEHFLFELEKYLPDLFFQNQENIWKWLFWSASI